MLETAHLCAKLVAELEPGTFGFLMQVANHYATRPVEFDLCTLAPIVAVVNRMLKTRVTLGNISRVLLNLIKNLIFIMFNV